MRAEHIPVEPAHDGPEKMGEPNEVSSRSKRAVISGSIAPSADSHLFLPASCTMALIVKDCPAWTLPGCSVTLIVLGAPMLTVKSTSRLNDSSGLAKRIL